VSIAGLAPHGAEGLDWFAGMQPSAAAGLRAALAGRAAKAAHEASAPEFDRASFTGADWATLAGPWAWLERVVGPGMANGPDGLIDDDMAYVSSWGFDCSQVSRPLLLLHGGQDRMVPVGHGQWLARHCPSAALWQLPGDGHLSVLHAAPRALDWLRQQASG